MKNPDLLVNAPSEAVAQAAMQLVDRLQSHPAAVQSVATAVLFLAVCQVHALDPRDALTVAGNMTADTLHGERPEFRALRLYARNELI